MRILIVEDSRRLARALKSGLRKEGHAADTVHDGKKGLAYARLNPYDVIVLDLMLPGLDGRSLLKCFRGEGRTTPVLILTAMDALGDKVRGFKLGADDYLVKPFAFEELLARIEALQRRSAGTLKAVIKVGDLHIDMSSRCVERAGQNIHLTAREFALLCFLAQHKGETVSRIEIEDHLYGEDNFPMSNAVSSAICNLRSRIDVPGSRELIHTRRGLGYVLDDEAP